MEETKYISVEDFNKLIQESDIPENEKSLLSKKATEVETNRNNIIGSGHWSYYWYPDLGVIDGKREGFLCSECGESAEYHENYCPNCGVKMSDDVVWK